MLGQVLVIPGSRGSCTGSQVMLELLLNGVAPAALILEQADEILALGVIVAEELFQLSLPIVRLGKADFARVAEANFVVVTNDGEIATFASKEAADEFDEGASLDVSTTDSQGPQLSETDRAMLKGDFGKAAQVAMSIVVR